MVLVVALNDECGDFVDSDCDSGRAGQAAGRHSGRFAAVACALAAWLSPGTAIFAVSQRGASDAAVITGTVVDAVSNRPVSGAVVATGPPPSPLAAARGRGRTVHQTRTDSAGRFSLAVPPAAHVPLQASKEGYVGGRLGQFATGVAGRPFAVAAGSRYDVTLRLWPAGIIDGQVTDADRQPLVRAEVRLFAVAGRAGHEALAPVVAAPRAVRTDDEGRYRLFDVMPGEYKVAVQTPRLASEQSGEFLTTWYPSTVLPSSSLTLEIEPGREYAGIDVRVPEGTASLHGKITGDDLPRWPAHVELRVEDPAGPPVHAPAASAPVAEDGGFVFHRVPEGQYRLRVVDFPVVRPGAVRQASASTGYSLPSGGPPLAPSDVPTLWGETRVAVDRGAERIDVTVPLQRGARIRGEVHFARVSGPPGGINERRAVAVLVNPADGSDLPTREAASVADNGSFQTVGVPPGRYQLSVTVMKGWSLESVVVDGQDRTGRPVDIGSIDVDGVVIRLRDRPPVLSGTVLEASRMSPAVAMVYVFPVDRALWTDAGAGVMLGAAVSDERGRFGVTGMPSGDYYVAATRMPPHGHPTAAFLSSLVREAEQVRLAFGEIREVTLRIRQR
jgi:hypothetical protein